MVMLEHLDKTSFHVAYVYIGMVKYYLWLDVSSCQSTFTLVVLQDIPRMF